MSAPPIPCFCCGSERMLYEFWGKGVCEDCDLADCTETECKATLDIILARIARDEAA